MHPSPVGVASRQTPHTDILHALRLPRAPRDAHYLHRLTEALTEGYERPLWASPAPGLLIIRALRLDETRLPADAHLSTTTRTVPNDDARVEWALVANPCKTEFIRGRRGVRRPLPEHEVPAWAERRLLGPLAEIAITGHTRMPALIGHNPKTGRTITHHRYAITGTAQVEEQDALAELLRTGVGPGKAFGCGLLTLQEATL